MHRTVLLQDLVVAQKKMLDFKWELHDLTRETLDAIYENQHDSLTQKMREQKSILIIETLGTRDVVPDYD